MTATKPYPAEVRSRAAGLVLEGEDRGRSRWATVSAVAADIGCSPKTLLEWVVQLECDLGRRPGLTTAQRRGEQERKRATRKQRRASAIRHEAAALLCSSGRPPTEAMVAFIDRYRDAFGVEPICEVLPISPSTYYDHLAKRAAPQRRSARAKRDEWLGAEIRVVWQQSGGTAGVRTIWRELRGRGHRVARCTVARLMKTMGLEGRSAPRVRRITPLRDVVDTTRFAVRGGSGEGVREGAALW